jgi:hypothetical protein
VDSEALLGANSDLWTWVAGYNQDIAIFVNGTLAAWKESGGFAGIFSPNAAFVQTGYHMTGGTTYTVDVRWKANHAPAARTMSSISAGAGPIAANFSPTRLTAVVVPAGADVLSSASTRQYSLANSDGASWQPLACSGGSTVCASGGSGDALSLSFTPFQTCTGVITANIDLWTAVTGYNQDVGIFVNGTLAGWKESGGFAGSFSPNAATAQNDFSFSAGTHYTIDLRWKTNHGPWAGQATTNFAGVGPINGDFSPTTLTAALYSCSGNTVPPSIASNCSVDVTSALTNFINSVPDNSTITFALNGCYLVQGTLQFSSRNGLTFEGNGASIKATTVADGQRAHWRFLLGSNITFHNMTIVGPNTAGSNPGGPLEWQHGLDLRGVTGATVSAMTIRNVYGDGLYVGLGLDGTTWTTGVNAHDNLIQDTGRNGVSVTAGKNVTLDHNTYTRPGSSGVDIEPNGLPGGGENVSITNSTFSVGGSASPFVGASTCCGGLVSGITITGNTVHGMSLAAEFLPGRGERWSNITFSNNTSDTAGHLLSNPVGLVVILAENIDGLTISNNYQPAEPNEVFIYASASSNVTQSGNQSPTSP